jgi:hypothetical protein
MELGVVTQKVDLGNMRVTAAHPDAEEAMVDGEIPRLSLSLHLNLTKMHVDKVRVCVTRCVCVSLCVLRDQRGGSVMA